jgi:hypothetical protein
MNTNRGRARHRSASIIGATAVVVSIGLGSVACSSETSTSTGAANTRPEPSTTSSIATSATTAAAASNITVTGDDYSFTGLPTSPVGVGTKLALKNASAKELHEMVVLAIPENEKRSADELVKLPMGELMGMFAGPPAAVIVAPPNADGFAAVGDGSLSKPGRYLVLCNNPTGADPAAYMKAAQASKGGPVSVPGGPPHMMAGMFGEITVT